MACSILFNFNGKNKLTNKIYMVVTVVSYGLLCLKTMELKML